MVNANRGNEGGFASNRQVNTFNAVINGQLEIVANAWNVGPVAAISFHREGAEGQLPALLPIFEFTQNGLYLASGLANRSSYHILGVGAPMPTNHR